MPTTGERKALLFLGALVALGAGVRAANHGDRPAPDAAAQQALASQIASVDSARSTGRTKPKARPRASTARTRKPRAPAAPKEPLPIIDLDIAPAEQIEELKGIGPKLAARIVADRDSLGPFGGIAELQRVKGIGPALAARLEPQVTFSRLPRHSRTANDGSRAPIGRKRRARRGETKN